MMMNLTTCRASRACYIVAGLLTVLIADSFGAPENSSTDVRYAQVAQGIKDAEKSVVDTANTAKETVEKSGHDAALKIEDLWRRVDENRLKTGLRMKSPPG